MSVIIRVTILLIILIDSFCSSTASSDKHPKVTRLDIRRCRCTHDDVPRGKLKCPLPLIPTDSKGKQDLNKCLCSAGTVRNRPDLLRFCVVQSATLL